MGKVVKFPRGEPDTLAYEEAPAPKRAGFLGKVVAAVVRWTWVLVVLIWPVVKWIVSIDVFIQALRAVYYWNDPAVGAVWTFLGHFAVLVALTYFVSVYKPKGL